ncbi:MAG: NAD-dependent epimerase/dehydratase family protein [Pirellulales bacterium]
MKVLITGGAGFIGSHTADGLLSHGYEVRVLDSLEEPVHPGHSLPAYLDKRIEFVRGDVRDEAALMSAIAGCDVIYHLAAFQDYLPVFSRFFDVNVTSTARIYELIVRERFPVRKVIVASSQATLGEGLYRDEKGQECLPDIRSAAQLDRGEWEVKTPRGLEGRLSWQRTSEDYTNAQNQYGLSKVAEENVALHLGRRYEIPTVAMRYSIVQGPRQSFYNAYSGACRVFCLSFQQHVDPSIFEDGKQVRDFVNIRDVVDANLLVLDHEHADYQKFHVGGDKAITVSEFASAVARVYRRNDYEPKVSGKYRYGDTRHICSDVSRLKALGWRPRREIEESIESYKYWLDQADSAEKILDYCNRQMQQLGVVRDVIQ